MKPHLVLVASFMLLLTVDPGFAKRDARRTHLSQPEQGNSRPKILFRIHRQAEDSYEEGGEYEYEEEGETPPANANEQEEEEKPTSAKEPEAEEYYDGDNYDEHQEESTTTPPTTTTTTTPEPHHESMEHIEDEDNYEERYEQERRRYEQETLRQQYEQTHGSDNESVEESREGRTREPETHETHEESDAEDNEDPSPTDPVPSEESEEPSTTEIPTVDLNEESPEVIDIRPGPKEHETDIEEIDPEEVDEVEHVDPPDVKKGDGNDVEIEESGRHDLERYSSGNRQPEEEERPEEEDEYNEIDEGEHEIDEPTTTPTTTTTSTTTTTTPEPERTLYGSRRDPYEYEVEQPNRNNHHEEDEYYERESEESPPSSTTTTTTTTPPPSSVENKIDSEEEDPDYGRRQRPYEEVETEDRGSDRENGRGSLDLHQHEIEEDNEIESGEKTESKEEVLYTTTTTVPTTPSTTTTTPLPYDPEPEEYEDEDEEDDGYEIYSTTTTTTPAPTYLPPTIGRVDTDSLENEIFDERPEVSEESGEEIRIDQARNQYEISPTVDPNERVIIEEITPKIECFSGYKLAEDGQECVDVDECESDVCGPLQICLNLPGSHKCSCPSGSIVDYRNPRNCRDLNECQNANGGCDQDCINIPGSFYCACADDFNLGTDGKKCIRKPTTTTTTTTTTTSTTTPPPTTTTTTTTTPIPTTTRRPISTNSISRNPFLPPHIPDDGVRNCPTPPVPKGTGIAYLYCSRSPVGIHHRHSQLERRLLQDWAARRNRTQQLGGRNNLRYRNRRNLLKRRLRQTTYSPGSMCELRCRPGFELRGQYTLHCNASDGTWQGTRNGFCQAIPKVDNQIIGISHSESTPSNEIPRLAPSDVSGFNQFRPSFGSLPTTSTTFRPTYYQPPPPAPTRSVRPEFRPLPPSTVQTTTSTTTTIPEPTTTSTLKPSYWPKPSGAQIPSRRPYYFSPSTPYSNRHVSSSSTSTTTPTSTTSRNSYIHLTYRFKTPWIKCPDDIRLDLPPNQNTAYVIIPQPQSNVDWWRQVTAEPSWAKGLESESGPGKQRITFRARTAAPVNNSAECSFTLEVRDNDPPRVRECPESFSTRLNQGQNAKPVQWMEPHFSDNVRITSLKKSHEPGAVLAFGEHLINYEAKDSSDNKARCSFTVTVLPPATSNQNNFNRRPVNTEGVTTPSTSSTSPKPEVHATLRNVVCYVGKKGRRIVFQSRVVPRGCSEMTVDVVGDAAGQSSFNTVNTITQNSAENSATSQISSVSFSNQDHPQQASAFSQSVSNGRNNNRLVHSTSSVTNGAHGTSSRASSYAIAVSSSSRNFDLPFLTPDKQVYEEDFVVPTQPPPPVTVKFRVGQTREGQTREGSGYRFGSNSSNNSEPYRKYFRHFDTWDTTTDSNGYRNRERD